MSARATKPARSKPCAHAVTWRDRHVSPKGGGFPIWDRRCLATDIRSKVGGERSEIVFKRRLAELKQADSRAGSQARWMGQ